MKNTGAHRNKDRGHYIEKIGFVDKLKSRFLKEGFCKQC